ncbi:MAG: hypothetical protein V5A64_00015 [Candidatus Thermoplasmatota archaeon]
MEKNTIIEKGDRLYCHLEDSVTAGESEIRIVHIPTNSLIYQKIIN